MTNSLELDMLVEAVEAHPMFAMALELDCQLFLYVSTDASADCFDNINRLFDFLFVRLGNATRSVWRIGGLMESHLHLILRVDWRIFHHLSLIMLVGTDPGLATHIHVSGHAEDSVVVVPNDMGSPPRE